MSLIMEILLNEEDVKKEGISLSSAIYLAALKNNCVIDSTDFQAMSMRGLVTHSGFDMFGNPINVKLTPQGELFIGNLMLDAKYKDKMNEEGDRFTELAKELRELYPKGLKPGTNYPWRDSVAIIAARLRSLVIRYKTDFTNEQAINAAKRYINSFNGDYTYMQILKYFISKQDRTKGYLEESSQLLAFIENEEQDVVDRNWEVVLR